MNLPFIYTNPIILSLLKIVALKFTMHILVILTYSLKLYVIRKSIFYNPDFFESHFQGTFSSQKKIFVFGKTRVWFK